MNKREIVFNVSLVLFLIILIYWGYFTTEPEKLMDQLNFGYIILLMLGIYRVSTLYYRLMKRIFLTKWQN